MIRLWVFLIFFHGGGWVTGNVDSYTHVCSNMANQTKNIVVSVDYRLAPRIRFDINNTSPHNNPHGHVEDL